jgi:ATP-binding cassette subfamily B protein
MPPAQRCPHANVAPDLLPAGVLCLWYAGRRPRATWCWSSSLGFAILYGTCDLAVMLVDMTQHVARQADAAQSLLVPDSWRK